MAVVVQVVVATLTLTPKQHLQMESSSEGVLCVQHLTSTHTPRPHPAAEIAPAQLRGKIIGSSVIWSALGVTMGQLVSGHCPRGTCWGWGGGVLFW